MDMRVKERELGCERGLSPRELEGDYKSKSGKRSRHGVF
jgi:hypothetical protein